ncbi:MAG TPA: DUF6166 domain-containing protein [Verrucomicrobiae bacterium]|jgi:hypothetical protein
MKQYDGRRTEQDVVVTVDGQPLNLRLDLWNHSPSGFEWGYAGSGPAQLALALLADCLDHEADAIGWHEGFKSAVVAALPLAGWTLTELEIRETIDAFENE